MEEDKKYINPTVELLWPELKEIIKNKNWNTLKNIISTWYAPDIADLL